MIEFARPSGPGYVESPINHLLGSLDPTGGPCEESRFGLALRALLGNLLSRPPCLRQPDGDRLLAGLHLLAGTPAAQGSGLPLTHGLGDFRAAGLTIFSRHGCL